MQTTTEVTVIQFAHADDVPRHHAAQHYAGTPAEEGYYYPSVVACRLDRHYNVHIEKHVPSGSEETNRVVSLSANTQEQDGRM